MTTFSMCICTAPSPLPHSCPILPPPLHSVLRELPWQCLPHFFCITNDIVRTLGKTDPTHMSLGRWLRPPVCQPAFFLWLRLVDPGPPHNHLYWGKKKSSALKDSLGCLSFWKITEFIFECIEGKLLGLMEHCSKKALHFLIFSHTQSDLE